jgi:GTP cyclohydrolase I
MENSNVGSVLKVKMNMRQEAVKLLLDSIEEDSDREGLLDTPKRVAKMYEEIFAGYSQDPKEILSRTFQEEHQEMVLVKDIPFYSHCEHHMVPFFGVVHVAYIPQGCVVGISKLARLVECYAKRLQIQERMTSSIADDIEKYLNAKGVAVIVDAEHLCMTMRGVKKPGAKTVTSAMRGVFKDNTNNARMEVLNLIK